MRRMAQGGLKSLSLPEPLLSSLCPSLWTLLGGRTRTRQLGQGQWGWLHGRAPVRGQGCCGLVRLVGSRCLWRGSGGGPCFSELLHQDQLLVGQISTCHLHLGASLPSRAVREVWARPWLASHLCPSTQGDLTIPPIGPVTESNLARVCSVLYIFPVKFIGSGELERESVAQTVSFWHMFKSPLRIHSFCALRDLRAWSYRTH